MKIAIIGCEGAYSLEFHIKDELTVQGHKAEIFDYRSVLPVKINMGLLLVSNAYIEKQNKKLLKNILKYDPDLVIGIYRHIHPLVVKAIKDHKIRIIHLNPDAITSLQNQQLFVEPYDAYYTKDPYMLNFMKNKLKLNVKLYSEAFNPRFHKRPELDLLQCQKEINIDVLCYGNFYPYRNRMLHILKDNNVKLTLYGSTQKHFDSYLSARI